MDRYSIKADDKKFTRKVKMIPEYRTRHVAKSMLQVDCDNVPTCGVYAYRVFERWIPYSIC